VNDDDQLINAANELHDLLTDADLLRQVAANRLSRVLLDIADFDDAEPLQTEEEISARLSEDDRICFTAWLDVAMLLRAHLVENVEMFQAEVLDHILYEAMYTPNSDLPKAVIKRAAKEVDRILSNRREYLRDHLHARHEGRVPAMYWPTRTRHAYVHLVDLFRKVWVAAYRYESSAVSLTKSQPQPPPGKYPQEFPEALRRRLQKAIRDREYGRRGRDERSIPVALACAHVADFLEIAWSEQKERRERGMERTYCMRVLVTKYREFRAELRQAGANLNDPSQCDCGFPESFGREERLENERSSDGA